MWGTHDRKAHLAKTQPAHARQTTLPGLHQSHRQCRRWKGRPAIRTHRGLTTDIRRPSRHPRGRNSRQLQTQVSRQASKQANTKPSPPRQRPPYDTRHRQCWLGWTVPGNKLPSDRLHTRRVMGTECKRTRRPVLDHRAKSQGHFAPLSMEPDVGTLGRLRLMEITGIIYKVVKKRHQPAARLMVPTREGS